MAENSAIAWTVSGDLDALADKINSIPAHDATQHDQLVSAAMKARALACLLDGRTFDELPT